jgi:hypothetical protein
MRSAFTKILENGLGQEDGMITDHQRDADDSSEILTRLAKDTEELAVSERESFSQTLRRWHPFPAAVAAATLHGCFGVVLKQYVAKAICLTDELVRVLHAASRLEKVLVQMVAEDVADSDDGRKSVAREVVPYDVESVVVGFLRTWIEERLRVARECFVRAKDTEVNFLDRTFVTSIKHVYYDPKQNHTLSQIKSAMACRLCRAGSPGPKMSRTRSPRWS